MPKVWTGIPLLQASLALLVTVFIVSNTIKKSISNISPCCDHDPVWINSSVHLLVTIIITTLNLGPKAGWTSQKHSAGIKKNILLMLVLHLQFRNWSLAVLFQTHRTFVRFIEVSNFLTLTLWPILNRLAFNSGI